MCASSREFQVIDEGEAPDDDDIGQRPMSRDATCPPSFDPAGTHTQLPREIPTPL